MTHGRAAILLCLMLAPALARAQQVRIGAADPFATGTLLGRVCDDRDADGRCSDDEPGLAKVRVVLDDGTYAISDAEGRYHFVGVPTRRSSIERVGESPIVREDLGRRSIKLDPHSLGAGGRAPELLPVVELGPGAMQTLDFPIRFDRAPPGKVTEIPSTSPRGEIREEGYGFLVTGRTEPGHTIQVGGRDADGTGGEFRVPVELKAGSNRLALTDLAPDGTLVLLEQRVDVIVRAEGDVLFVPRPFEARGTLHLPRVDSPVQAGSAVVVVNADERTTLQIGQASGQVGADGRARLNVELRSGGNPLAVRVSLPDGLVFERVVRIEGRAALFGAGLLGVQLSYETGTRELSAVGSGAGFVETTLGATELLAGANLDLGDVLTLTGPVPAGRERDALILLRPRAPYAIERALDPESVPAATADDGLTGALNPSGARLYARVRHPEYGGLQLGSFHASLAGADYGQYHRSLFGASGEGRLPLGPMKLKASAFASPPPAAGATGLPLPAHDELAGTGGSLFYLRHASVLPGSEKLRIEVRDPITGLPLDEQILVRDLDYQIDYRGGRILLARPLPMALGNGPFLAQTPLDNFRPMLVADYEHVPALGGRSQTAGGRAGVETAWGGLSATAVQERRFGVADADYQLASAHGKVRLGPFSLVGSLAQSRGFLFGEQASGGFGLSDSGGLSWGEADFLRAPDRISNAGSVRASWSQERFGGQLWFLAQQAGFNDSAHGALSQARQAGGRARAQLGRVELTAFADDRVGADPRAPLSEATIAGRDAYLRARIPFDRLTLSAEGKFNQLTAPTLLGGEAETGGRAGLGLRADYRIVRELSVNAAHHQKLVDFGSGIGARNDTFTSAGVSYTPRDDLGLSARGGWGPVVGTQVQASAERTDGDEIAYGSYTVDVDGPDAGRTVAVSGARKRVDEEAEVFAEELFARELNGLRAGRAVGLQFEPVRNLGLVARYERGLRMPLLGERALLRDAGGLQASWLMSGLRLSAYGELRRERGEGLFEAPVDRWQGLATLAAEARPLRWLGLTGRLNLSKTLNNDVLEAQLIEGLVGAGVRLSPFALLLQYSVTDELSTLARALRQRARTQLILLQPSVEIGRRARLGAGGWLALQQAGGAASTIVAASLRPSVRLFGNLWAAVEVARRSAAPEDESLNAVRGELSYWFDETVGVGLGYNFHGFSGFGVGGQASRNDRVYLRMEAAW